MDPISMVCPPGAGCPLNNLLGIGLPEVLLWVLAFAIVFAVLKNLINRKSALLVSIVLAFFVLMAIPATLIEFLASMSTSLIVLLIGVLVVLALIGIAQPAKDTGKVDKDGKPIYTSWLASHGTAVAIVVLILAALVFIASGGLEILGLSALVPAINTGTILLVIIGAAVLWMVAEAAE